MFTQRPSLNKIFDLQLMLYLYMYPVYRLIISHVKSYLTIKNNVKTVTIENMLTVYQQQLVK